MPEGTLVIAHEPDCHGNCENAGCTVKRITMPKGRKFDDAAVADDPYEWMLLTCLEDEIK